jgi:hypothetical protein
MPFLELINGRAYLGVSFELEKFPAMILQHGEDFEDTLQMEQTYAHLIEEPFDHFQAVAAYIRDVCRWGHYAGVGGKVLKNNSEEAILGAFEAARGALLSDTPNLVAALTSLNRLHGLGTASFASKHLRFLRPEWCPVYDSVLNNVLPYDSNPTGYAQFAEDCHAIAQALCERSIQNPVRNNEIIWHVGDVEAAIFSEFFD